MNSTGSLDAYVDRRRLARIAIGLRLVGDRLGEDDIACIERGAILQGEHSAAIPYTRCDESGIDEFFASGIDDRHDAVYTGFRIRNLRLAGQEIHDRQHDFILQHVEVQDFVEVRTVRHASFLQDVVGIRAAHIHISVHACSLAIPAHILYLRFGQVVRQDAGQFLVGERERGIVETGVLSHCIAHDGSDGMAGAAVLATRACIRSGVGKVTTLTPRCNYAIMQMSVPEAIVHPDSENYYSEAISTEEYNAVGIGPGLGRDEGSALALMSQLQQTQCPVVLDADALNMLGSHGMWISQLPDNMIMTPHPRELDRLAGTASHSEGERLAVARDMAENLRAYIMLKGHYTALCMPDGSVMFNTTGNSGMATAGSGDVLTGIITGLLARGYSRKNACVVGMYLHGLAGDIAAQRVGKESLVASDIIAALPDAFKALY